MTINISDGHALAVKKYAAPVFRQLGVKDLNDFQPHKLEWKDLNERGKAILKSASKLIDCVKDDSDEEECRQIEQAYNALIEIHDACETEKDRRNQVGSRSPRKVGGDPRRPLGADDCVNADGSPSRRTITEADTVGLKREDRMADWAYDRGVPAHEDLTLGRYLRSMVLGAKNEVEQRALAEGTDSAGGYTTPETLAADLIDLMRANTVSVNAGAITVPLTSDVNHIAKVATDPVPAWRAENAAVNESDPTFDRVTFAPKSLAVMVKCSRELLEDSLNMELMLPQIMASAMAVEVDRVALFGSGTDPEPEGLVNVTGVNAIAHDAELTAYTPLIRARTKCLEANSREVTAYILHPRDDGRLAELVDANAQPLQVPPKIAPIPMLTSTSVPNDEGAGSDESTIITGDFRRLMLGIRNGVRIEVLRERFAENMQYAFLAHLRMDVAVEHGAAFCKITGVNPTP